MTHPFCGNGRISKLIGGLLTTALVASRPGASAAQSIRVPESITADGVPAIARNVADDAARYNDFRNAVLVDWHPTRREILILTRFAETYQVHRVAHPLAAREQLTFSS